MLLFAVILALTFTAGFILPWWAVAPLAFLAALFIKTTGRAFWCGFGGVGIAWLALALLKTFPNNNILATRMAALFHLPHWTLVLLVTVLIGGLIGGFAALTGKLFRVAFMPEKKSVE